MSLHIDSVENRSGAPRQAVVLVGGRGSRLGALAAETPKPLMTIAGGRLFLDYLLRNIARHGVKEILLLAGHLGEQVMARYDGAEILGARLRVLIEPEPAGTAGALVRVREQLDECFFLLNGDGFLDCNLLALPVAPLPPGGARLFVRQVDDASRYGSVRSEGDQVVAFDEKAPTARPGLINGGVYWMNVGVLDRITHLPCSMEQDIFPELAKAGLLSSITCDGYFIDIGLPDTLAKARAELPNVERRPVAFFDRDGTLNVDRGHTHEPGHLEWIDGAIPAIRSLNDAGWYVIVCTNQAGVARGYYDEAAVRRFHAAMQYELSAEGAHIDAFYYCPHHADAVADRYRHPDHPDRKPNPGMLVRALAEWPARPEESLMIGDSESDVQAATGAGLRGLRFAGGNLRTVLAEAGAPCPAES